MTQHFFDFFYNTCRQVLQIVTLPEMADVALGSSHRYTHLYWSKWFLYPRADGQ